MTEDKTIKFINGIIGLEQYKKYILLDHPGTDVLKWLQSKDNSKISIPVASPIHFFPDYSPVIKKDELDMLNIISQDDALLLCVITVPQDPRKTTVNLKAPIVINPKELLADQIICENDEYLIKQPLVFKNNKNRWCGSC